jgi:hypothetical protein
MLFRAEMFSQQDKVQGNQTNEKKRFFFTAANMPAKKFFFSSDYVSGYRGR